MEYLPEKEDANLEDVPLTLLFKWMKSKSKAIKSCPSTYKVAPMLEVSLLLLVASSDVYPYVRSLFVVRLRHVFIANIKLICSIAPLKVSCAVDTCQPLCEATLTKPTKQYCKMSMQTSLDLHT